MRIKNKLLRSLSAVIFLFTLRTAADVKPPARVVSGEETRSLQGRWGFSLDADRQGIQEKWYTKNLPEQVMLPGTTDENHKGEKTEKFTASNLNRIYHYEGPAWYRKEITVPAEWADKSIHLFLERTKATTVWLDGRLVGSQKQLSVPHVYNLTGFTAPGKHVLTVCVDNTRDLFPMKITHALSERTQGNWNGIIGRMELIARDLVCIDDVQIYPSPEKKEVRIRVVVQNSNDESVSGQLNFRVEDGFSPSKEFGSKNEKFVAVPGESIVEVVCRIKGFKCWDEFSPHLYRMAVTMTAAGKNSRQYSDSRSEEFGMRIFRIEGTQFSINGRTTFLRGKHDACVFPLTGYPPMTAAEWERVFNVAKSFGINFYRFHSWCPPEAAFEAADKAGMYLQPELPMWAKFEGNKLTHYLTDEGRLILKYYGNHPSFVMLSLGNELDGDFAAINSLMHDLKARDPRHLYAPGSNNSWANPELSKGGDYWTTSSTYREGGQVAVRVDLTRGSMIHDYLGYLNNAYPPSTTNDYRRAIACSEIPVISHELGQYSMFPDFNESRKYTGVFRSGALEEFRKRLEEKEMSGQADRFFKASGALAAICYREDIESVLRTKGIGGFALLDLQDYPGQGTAFVGMVDAFMDPKGIIAPEKWRQFCSETVPLLLIPKRTWTAGETITAQIKIANYGPSAIRKNVVCSLNDSEGNIIICRKLNRKEIPGGLVEIGSVEFPLAGIKTPQKLNIKIQIEGTAIQNSYDIWIYPDEIKYQIPSGLILTRTLDEKTMARLKGGAKVLLLPDLFDLRKSERGQFIANFWTIPFFKNMNPPGTLGIVCNPEHPVFKDFPTDFHSDWQWWPMTKYARPVILDEMPKELTPLVQVIDNYETNRKLGLIFEARVGKGKLMFCASDFLNNRDKPEVRQLLYSIMRYMDSEVFDPKVQIEDRVLMNIFAADMTKAGIESKMDFPERAGIKVQID